MDKSRIPTRYYRRSAAQVFWDTIPAIIGHIVATGFIEIIRKIKDVWGKEVILLFKKAGSAIQAGWGLLARQWASFAAVNVIFLSNSSPRNNLTAAGG